MMYLRTLPLPLVFGALLFTAAGEIGVPAFWLYIAMVWLVLATTYTLLSRSRPDLVAERLRPPSDRDRATRRVVVPLLAAHLVLAGLDVGRLQRSAVPLALQAIGFALCLTGFGFAAWTVFTNPFASSAVRIQEERAQEVIMHGPYALVRHPMYLGVVLVCVGSGLALGSYWAGLALLPIVPLFVRRTRLEDRMLHDELPGYRAYAARVRWRIVPLVY